MKIDNFPGYRIDISAKQSVTPGVVYSCSAVVMSHSVRFDDADFASDPIAPAYAFRTTRDRSVWRADMSAFNSSPADFCIVEVSLW